MIDNSTTILNDAKQSETLAAQLAVYGNKCPRRAEFADLITQISNHQVNIQKAAGGWEPEMAKTGAAPTSDGAGQ